MRFVRTSQDADTHNKDACCGEFFATLGNSGEDVPENERAGSTVYCYTKCGNCGAIWRDGFKDGHHTEHVYNGYGDQPFVWDEFDFEYSHIDTNKLHDGRAIVVYTPTNNPLDTWAEEGYVPDEEISELRNEYDMSDFRKEETYVFRFCEVAQDTVCAVPIDALLTYQPEQKPALVGRVEDLTFHDGTLESIDFELVEAAGQYEEGDSVTVSASNFAEHGTVDEDPWAQVISRRPSL